MHEQMFAYLAQKTATNSWLCSTRGRRQNRERVQPLLLQLTSLKSKGGGALKSNSVAFRMCSLTVRVFRNSLNDLGCDVTKLNETHPDR